MTELRTILVEEGMEGADPIHYRLGEQVWPDRDSYEACMQSPEYAAMREHGKMLCEKYGVSVTAEFGDPVDWKLEN
jgi:quinol monooxygenase YgiN